MGKPAKPQGARFYAILWEKSPLEKRVEKKLGKCGNLFRWSRFSRGATIVFLKMPFFFRFFAFFRVLHSVALSTPCGKVKCKAKEQAKNIDSNFGSELFAAKTHFPNGLSSDGTYSKQADYDECVYIFNYEAESKKNAIDAIKSVNDYSNTQIQKILDEKIEERISKGLPVTEEWINEERINAIKLIYPIKDVQVQKKLGALGKLMYNLELNKNQY